MVGERDCIMSNRRGTDMVPVEGMSAHACFGITLKHVTMVVRTCGMSGSMREEVR